MDGWGREGGRVREVYFLLFEEYLSMKVLKMLFPPLPRPLLLSLPLSLLLSLPHSFPPSLTPSLSSSLPPSLPPSPLPPSLPSPQTVGVIVRLEKETFKVLTQHGKDVSAKPHALQLRKTRGVTLDARQVRTFLQYFYCTVYVKKNATICKIRLPQSDKTTCHTFMVCLCICAASVEYGIACQTRHIFAGKASKCGVLGGICTAHGMLRLLYFFLTYISYSTNI